MLFPCKNFYAKILIAKIGIICFFRSIQKLFHVFFLATKFAIAHKNQWPMKLLP